MITSHTIVLCMYINIFIDCRIERDCQGVRDTVVKGVTVEKGITVSMPVWQIYRDPEIWEDPEAFIPERYAKFIPTFCFKMVISVFKLRMILKPPILFLLSNLGNSGYLKRAKYLSFSVCDD